MPEPFAVDNYVDGAERSQLSVLRLINEKYPGEMTPPVESAVISNFNDWSVLNVYVIDCFRSRLCMLADI